MVKKKIAYFNLLMKTTNIKQFISHSYEETIIYGKTLGSTLSGGELLILKGDLGCGKTALTKGIAIGLGIEDNVTSPSFTLINVYEGDKLNLCHIDLYRIEDENSFWDLGIEEYISPNYVVIIEWGDRFINELPHPLVVIEINIVKECNREITLRKVNKDN